MYVFELAHYEISLNDFDIVIETSQDSLRVIYEDFLAVWKHYSPITESSSQTKLILSDSDSESDFWHRL